MEPTTQAVPAYFVWEVPGQALVIHMNLDLVDRLGAEIMRGFGAIPKRGAEVGGVLLGSIETGDVTVVRVEDFEAVPCEYQRGPSYLFEQDPRELFDLVCARWQPGPAHHIYAVGYYRSHTRAGPVMTREDIELLDQCFPFPAHVALLVKPYAAKASQAAFFVRQNGKFPETALFEFPFLRRELALEPADSPAPSKPDPAPLRIELPRPLNQPVDDPVDGDLAPSFADAAKPRSSGLPGWIWIPLSFVFLILGLLLGHLLTKASHTNTDAAFSLALSVVRTGDNLTVQWNHDAPAVRAAQKGVLEIEDGAYSKPVALDLAQLQGGSLIYRNSSNRVRFRLIVSVNARSSVTETLEWRQ
jgi:hypothetical protein